MPTPQEKIDLLLGSLEAQEPSVYELGTPQLVETDEINELINLGYEIVPYLLTLADTKPPKVVAYIVLALRKLGDLRALGALRELRNKYQAFEPKTEWIYAVIGQCNLALSEFERAMKGRNP